MEVLGELERFYVGRRSRLASRRDRAEERGTRVSVRWRCRSGQRALGDPGTRGSSASLRSCGVRTTWKTSSSRSGRGSCRDELGFGCATGSTIRSSSSTSVRGCAGSRWRRAMVVVIVLCTCIVWAGYENDAFVNGRAFEWLVHAPGRHSDRHGGVAGQRRRGGLAAVGHPRLSPRLTLDTRPSSRSASSSGHRSANMFSSPARCRSCYFSWLSAFPQFMDISRF